MKSLLDNTEWPYNPAWLLDDDQEDDFFPEGYTPQKLIDPIPITPDEHLEPHERHLY